eukprot:733005-Rhodomonas_salina.2
MKFREIPRNLSSLSPVASTLRKDKMTRRSTSLLLGVFAVCFVTAAAQMGPPGPDGDGQQGGDGMNPVCRDTILSSGEAYDCSDGNNGCSICSFNYDYDNCLVCQPEYYLHPFHDDCKCAFSSEYLLWVPGRLSVLRLTRVTLIRLGILLVSGGVSE